MNNLPRKNNLTDMQVHIDKAFIIIDKHLPVTYVEKVLEKLSHNKNITKTVIQNVRQKKSKASSNLEVFNAIVEVAIENKKEQQRLKKLITY
jgi:hypothetical protein